MTITASVQPIPEAPFRGIEPLRFVDQMIFTARESEIWNLERNITIHRGVLLYGDSGTGKSSLVNAGLIPRLLEEDYIADRLRVQPRLGKEIKIERISTSADGKPPYLDSTFTKDDTTLSFEVSIEKFIEQLQSFKPPADAERETAIPVEVRCPILIFDQFEEFITLFEEAMRMGATEEAHAAAQAQEKILHALVGLLQDKLLPIKILLVFREDYLAKLNILFEQCPNLLDQYLRLLPPRVEDLKQIIRAPFEKEELREQFLKSHVGGGGSEITKKLAEKVAAELSKRSEAGRANLSELQIVCRSLWESTDPDALFEKEGVRGLLEQYLSASLGEFPEDLRSPAVALLGHMITSSDTRNIVSKDDLLKFEKVNFSLERIEGALAALTRSKLVTLEVRHNVYFYEIVSEFLVPWIKEQKAARQALIARRKLEEEAERKAEQARIEAEKRAEQERLAAKLKLAQQQKRYVMVASVAIVAILLLLFMGSALFFRQRRIATEKLKEVRAEQEQAVRETESARLESENAAIIADKVVKVTSRSTEDKLQALDDLDELVKARRMNPQIALAILLIAGSDQDQTVASKALEIVREVSKSEDDPLAQAINSAADSKTGLAQKLMNGLPARFSIKLANSDQEKRANRIKEALEQKGYIVARFEVVDAEAPATNKLRYSIPAETGDLDPDAILALLRETDSQKWTKEPLSSDPARPRNFEIWLAREIIKLGNLLVNFQDEDGNVIGDVRFDLFIKNLSSSYTSQTALGSGGTYPLPSGKYRLTVRAKGYRGVNMDFLIKEGKDTQLDLTVHRK